MICKSPYVMGQGSMMVACGRCAPCRAGKVREWAHRIELEASLHEVNCFLTLTYDDEHLPEGNTLEPSHLTLFIKRLRERFRPNAIRYFACGEYGDRSERPHYHLVVF